MLRRKSTEEYPLEYEKRRRSLECANEAIRLLTQAGYGPQRKNGSMVTAYLVKAIISNSSGLLPQARLELEEAMPHFDKDEVNRQIAEALLTRLQNGVLEPHQSQGG